MFEVQKIAVIAYISFGLKKSTEDSTRNRELGTDCVMNTLIMKT